MAHTRRQALFLEGPWEPCHMIPICQAKSGKPRHTVLASSLLGFWNQSSGSTWPSKSTDDPFQLPSSRKLFALAGSLQNERTSLLSSNFYEIGTSFSVTCHMEDPLKQWPCDFIKTMFEGTQKATVRKQWRYTEKGQLAALCLCFI